MGADVRIVARIPKLSWNDPNPARLGPLGQVKRPVTQLCEGWHCAFWYQPTLFRAACRKTCESSRRGPYSVRTDPGG